MASQPIRALEISPDSKRIGFARAESDRPADYYEVRLTGGAPAKVIGGVSYPISFSPDGSRFAFGRWDPLAGRSSVRSASSDGTGEQAIIEYKFPLYCGATAWRPEGDVVAFSGTPTGFFKWDVMVQAPYPRAPARVLTPHRFYRINAIQWVQSGEAMVFEGQEKSCNFDQQIWHMTYPAGKLTRLTSGLDWHFGISATHDSRVLATVREQSVSQILLLGKGDIVRQLTTPSSAYEGWDGLAFVGDRLVFSSEASGCKSPRVPAPWR